MLHQLRAGETEVDLAQVLEGGFKPDLVHHSSSEEQFLSPGTDLSIFLLLALRKATIPSFASASKENGSIP